MDINACQPLLQKDAFAIFVKSIFITTSTNKNLFCNHILLSLIRFFFLQKLETFQRTSLKIEGFMPTTIENITHTKVTVNI
jgi:hypothetical protein